MPIIDETSNWQDLRKPGMIEVDFHFGQGTPNMNYHDAMDEIYQKTEDALREAYEKGTAFVMFRHGSSTSGPGRTTARSQVRKACRDHRKDFVEESKSIQHYSVFIAAIKTNAS